MTETGDVEHATPVQPLVHGSPLAHPDNDAGKPVAFQKSTRAFVSGPEVAAAAVVAVGDRSASSETRTTPLKGDTAKTPSRATEQAARPRNGELLRPSHRQQRCKIITGD